MAAVEVTISGVLYDKVNRTTQNVVLIGEASLTGLGIGGGPIIPPPGQPPSSGVPTHPIMLPGMPGWGVPPDAHPEHPIVIPPDVPPDIPAPPDLFTWHVAWTDTTGWVVVAVPNVPHPVPSKK